MGKWFEMKNQTENAVDLYFYGDIVGDEWGKWTNDDKCPSDVVEALKGCVGKELNIYINSGGGDVFGGMAICNILKRHSCKKTVHIDGIAGSISSVIAMAGDEIIMPGNVYLMLHKPYSCCVGNAAELKKLADTLDVLEQGMMAAYESKIADGVDIATIQELVNNETWLTGKQAKEYFNVTVIEDVKAVACISDSFKNYKMLPSGLEKASTPIEPPLSENPQSNVQKERLQMQLELLSM